MWQTKYALAVPKNFGLGLNIWPCSEGYFLSGRLQSVTLQVTALIFFPIHLGDFGVHNIIRPSGTFLNQMGTSLQGGSNLPPRIGIWFMYFSYFWTHVCNDFSPKKKWREMPTLFPYIQTGLMIATMQEVNTCMHLYCKILQQDLELFII